MILRTRTIFFSGFGGVFFVVFGAAALASDLVAGGASERATTQCAAYGPGFAPIEGSQACIWVGGHVTVGFVAGGAVSATGTAVRLKAGNAAFAGPRPATGHLRLRDDDATGTIAR